MNKLIGAFAISFIFMGWGCASSDFKKDLHQKTPVCDKAVVEKGDLVKVNYTVSLEDGKLVRTNLSGILNDSGHEKVPFFDELPKQIHFGPEETMAGDKAGIPGVPGLAEAVLGISAGDRKTVTLPPEKAYGKKDAKLIRRYDRVKRVPRLATLGPEAYVKTFRAFPLLGKEMNLTPYFKSKIIEVTEHQVKLDALAEDGGKIEHDYGTTVIGIEGDEVVLTLAPRMGAPFVLEGRKGIITVSDGEKFTVDFNHPLQGKTVMVNVELVGLTKASAFEKITIPWTEDHDQGLERAAKEDKPVLAVLYSPTCGWSKRLLDETMQDPRIKRLRDDFIWVKVDSNKNKDLYEYYNQDGYPLILFLSASGEEIKRIEGYRPAKTLEAELRVVLQQKVAQNH